MMTNINPQLLDKMSFIDFHLTWITFLIYTSLIHHYASVNRLIDKLIEVQE